MSKKITASIIGATGYVGLELIRIINVHPNIKIKYLTSFSGANKKISDFYPHLQGNCDIKITNLDIEQITNNSEVIFLALPHLESQKIMKKIIGKTKIIDLSGDFRIKNPHLYKKYYGQEHKFKPGINQFIYGLPEENEKQIKQASNIANPGCFATSMQLALLPLKGKIKTVNMLGLTGSSGSGKNPKDSTHHPIRNNNVTSYKIGTHQHLPEVLQILDLDKFALNFVPTSGSFVRGIHLTAFVDLQQSLSKKVVKKLFEQKYNSAPFIRIKENIALAEVLGSNFCDISIQTINKKLIIQTVIDNLVKGAAGNAIQNFNLMFSFNQDTGLNKLTPIYP